MSFLAKAEFRKITSFLLKFEIYFVENVILSDFSYLKTGGCAQLIVYPKNRDQISNLLIFLKDNNFGYKVVGNTSNLLFLDDVNYPLLISSSLMNSISVDQKAGVIVAGGGAMMPDLSRAALQHSLVGFEGLEGIPGTIGGGVFMNAGAYGAELKDKLVSAEIALADGSVRTFSLEDLGLSHRSSVLRREASGGFVCSLRFKSEFGDATKIFGKMEVFHAKRHKYQDFMYPNLGSIFSGSPYRALGCRDPYFRRMSALYYILNYRLRLHRRESPMNRRWLNNLVLKRFNLEYKIQPFSDKTLNCLVNRGQGTQEMVRFIRQMEELIDDRAPLENEIVEEF